MNMAKTEITFRFLAPYGFSLDGKGNFYPELKAVIANAENGVDMSRLPSHFGNMWVNGYDFKQEYSITLLDEEPREIPDYINDIEDDATRAAFKVKSAEAAADNHAANNIHRDELRRMVGLGKIEIVKDSFMDKKGTRKSSPPAPVAILPLTPPSAEPPRRGRPPNPLAPSTVTPPPPVAPADASVNADAKGSPEEASASDVTPDA